MKLGLGLYKHLLTRDNFRFAKQAGATHIVAHLVDYFRQSQQDVTNGGDQPTGGCQGWGRAGDPEKIWALDELLALRQSVEQEGLRLEAIENLDPAHWYDILLEGPQRAKQIENVKRIIQRMGQAGIPTLGYNFSIAGVCGRIRGSFARGGAESVGMDEAVDDPIPNGMVWNMVYDPEAPAGHLPPVSHDELWQRLTNFLEEVLPVAEEASVTLALHPDDPPMPTLRGTPRLVYRPDLYQKLIDLQPSPRNQLEFCLGSIAEMADGDVYEATERYAAQNRIAYIHARNVRGKVPQYREVFIDEGDIDFLRVLRGLKKHNYDGVLIPDHTPQMTCAAPWHAGMAYALGYLRAAIQTIEAA
jgi:mannonate dehydratase